MSTKSVLRLDGTKLSEECLITHQAMELVENIEGDYIPAFHIVGKDDSPVGQPGHHFQ